MKANNVYVDLHGTGIMLDQLDVEERKLVARLRRRAKTHPDWCDFGSYWMREITKFYDNRGVPRKQSKNSPVVRIAQDLSSRIGIAAGFIREPDYRSELEGLVRDHYKSRREFCKATGLSEDMLSHVLAGRKDLSISALTDALNRIGYRLRIMPTPERKQTG